MQIMKQRYERTKNKEQDVFDLLGFLGKSSAKVLHQEKKAMMKNSLENLSVGKFAYSNYS